MMTRFLKRAAFGVLGVATIWAGSAMADDAAKAKADTYPLTKCPVSGKELGDKPVVKNIDGREVRFCCEGCPAKFEADKAKYNAKMDEEIIAAQKDSYPLDTCVVSGEKLGDMGKGKDVVVDNHLVRLCCPSCEKNLRKEPAKYIAKIDEAAAKKAEKSEKEEAPANKG